MSKPKISVIMPVYNVEKYIGLAIESILNQSYRNFELVIINDHSKDKTLSIIKSYMKVDKRIRLINNKNNLKIAASLNEGIKQAKGDIVARMDSDDISHKDRLKKQYAYLKKYPKIAVVGSDIEIINVHGEYISSREYPAKSKDLKKVMFRYSPFAHPVVMYRKKVFEEFGGYDIYRVPCEDIDLWFKIGSKYNFGSIQEKLLSYRLLYDSGSHSKLKKIEFLGFKIKIEAILYLNYRPGVYDIFYNLFEYLSIWIMPDKFRIKFYNLLRSKNII